MEEKKKKEKKTNYQRLWRQAKKMEILTFNFCQDMEKLTRDFVKSSVDEKKFKDWEDLMTYVKKKYNKLKVEIN